MTEGEGPTVEEGGSSRERRPSQQSLFLSILDYPIHGVGPMRRAISFRLPISTCAYPRQMRRRRPTRR